MALVAACLGVMLAFLSFIIVRQYEWQQIENEFEHLAGDRIKAIGDDAKADMVILQACDALYEAEDTVNRYEFAVLAAPFLAWRPDIEALEWVPRVTDSQRAAFEAGARQEGFPNFQITERAADGSLVRAGRRDEYFPVCYAEPRRSNESTFGFDLASVPAVREAMARGRKTHQAVGVRSPAAVPPHDCGPTMLIGVPVFHKRGAASTGPSVSDGFQGFLVRNFCIKECVEEAFERLVEGGVDVHVFDDSAAAGDRHLYSHYSRMRKGPAQPISPAADDVAHPLRRSARARVADNVWRVVCTPAPGFIEGRQSWQPWGFLAGGLLLTGIVAAYLVSSARQRAMLEAEVEERRSAQETLKSANAVLEQQTGKLRALASEITLTEYRERRRLAGIIHDNLQQLLVGAKFRVHELGRSQAPEVRGIANDLNELLDQSIDVSRSLTGELGPPALQTGGLIGALKWLAEWMEKKHGLSVAVRASEEASPENKEVSILLFQSVRELLFNVVKHAKVKVAHVEVDRADEQIRLVVWDEGAGFDTSAAAGNHGGGFGLLGIRERLELMGGRMEVQSSPGRGSRFTLWAPLVMKGSE